MPVPGPEGDQPVPTVVRCRKRQQDVAPFEGLSMRFGNGTSWSGRCEGDPDHKGDVLVGNYAGVDWATDKHDVLVEDEAGEQLVAATFADDEKGLGELCRMLVRLEVKLVAIERPDGVLVERLPTRGCGCWRCIPTRSRRPGRGFGSRAGSLTGLTRS